MTASESMTGYGEARATVGGATLICRARSLNHRFLDLKVRLPRSDMTALDQAIRRRVAETFKRGAVELTLTLEAGKETQTATLNARTAEAYVKQARVLAKKVKLSASSLSLDGLLRLPGVVDSGTGSGADALENLSDEAVLKKLVDPALAALKKARAAEGKKLTTILLEHLAEMQEHVKAIAAAEQPEKERARAQLIERAQDTLRVLESAQGARATSGPDLENFNARLREEAVFWIERRDFAEERSRLEMHLKEFHRQLTEEASGRKLEFLIQEILREINTLGTKAQVPVITARTIELKTILERIREQLANIE